MAPSTVQLKYSLIVEVKDAPNPEGFDLVIVGSGIYNESFLPEVMDYIYWKTRRRLYLESA